MKKKIKKYFTVDTKTGEVGLFDPNHPDIKEVIENTSSRVAIRTTSSYWPLSLETQDGITPNTVIATWRREGIGSAYSYSEYVIEDGKPSFVDDMVGGVWDWK